MIADLAAYFGSLMILLGGWRLGKKRIDGWVLFLIGDASWIVAGILYGKPAITICETVFLVIHLVGLYRWLTDRPVVLEV